MGQNTLSPGPTLLLVQANYPQTNTGEKGASDEDRVSFHLDRTREALARLPKNSVDLAVWSETMMPPINQESRDEIDQYLQTHYPSTPGEPTQSRYDLFLNQIESLARRQKITLLVGGIFASHWRTRDDGSFAPAENRNTAYFIGPDGGFKDGKGERYDKIHLVLFGEYIPFRGTWLYPILLSLGPPDMADYQLVDGSDNGLTVFHLTDRYGPARFVTPICFEDLDANLCAQMFQPGPDGRKRADMLVNLTNDGWFKGGENAQHFQAAIFRAIENRAPMARCVNTGISGFIDSCGRVSDPLPVRTAGTTVASVQLDSRLTFYTLHGDVFAYVCIGASGLIAGLGLWQNWMATARFPFFARRK
jgi:apolipoprotein N-acyltransferase